MKFKTDENLPIEATLTLREFGFDAQTVGEEALSGAADEVVSARARAESRVLITLDMDFANIRAYPPEQHAGIVVFRLKAHDKATIVAHVRRLAVVLKERSPEGELWIVERDRVRFRQSK